LGCYHVMEWCEETVHALVLMHDWKHQKQLEEAIRDLVRLAVERAKCEACEAWRRGGIRRRMVTTKGEFG